MDVDLEKAVRPAVGRAAEKSREFSSQRLDELGWGELLEADAESAIRVLFEEQGRLLISSSALDSVVLPALNGPWEWPSAHVVFPLPARSTSDAGPGTDIEGVLFTRETFDTAVLPLATDNGVVVHTVDVAKATLNPVDGMDETLGLARFTANRADAVAAQGSNWSDGLSAGRRAIAHELVGLARQMLSIAVEHVKVREQFGRPLGANQAVQHRLADTQVEIASAEMIADEAWNTPTGFAATTAKAQAVQAFNTTAKHGQQVLGGIGYTWEHDWRHHVRRGFVLAGLLGAADECELEIAQTLIDDKIIRLGNLL